MLLGEIFRVALSSLRANKLRSGLTMLGMVIGVASVIAMIALGNGAENAIKDRISRLGTTTLQINSRRVSQNGVQSGTWAKITMADVAAIRERASNVVDINHQNQKQLQVTWRDRNTNTSITGTSPNFLTVRHFKMAIGRMFTDADDRARRRVAVIGADVLPLLGIGRPAALMGEEIRLGGRQFTVIGVLDRRGAGQMGDADSQVLIPYQTGRFDLFGTDRLADIWAQVSSEDSIPAAMAEIQAAMRRSHRIPIGRPDDFSIQNQADFLATLSETSQTFTALLAGVAAVSLLVGGIGIMNIMLVSVTERTREIGIRKALGATRANILLQFLVEAVVLCLAGGAIGIAAGVGVSVGLHQSLGWNTAMNGAAVGVAFAFSAGIGILFGVWPARRAAVLDPIVALRYE